MEDKSLTNSAFSTETTESQSDNYIDPALGAYIRKLRKDRGMSIRELAEAAGCSAAHVTRIELAQRRDSMKTIVSLADALNVPTEELLSMAGQHIQNSDSLVKVAFPSVNTAHQESVISSFAQLVTSGNMTDEQMDQILIQATAYSEYCARINSAK